MTGKWVSLAAACQSINISESTLRRRIEQGQIESKLENGRRLVLIDPASQMTVTEADPALIEQLQGEVEYLRQELDRRNRQIEDLEESRQRQDTIMLQLTRQLEQSQRLLEHHREPFWRRWLERRRRTTEFEPQ